MGDVCDAAIVGGGPAGLAAAVAARKANPDARVVVLERDAAAGGILRQCIHNGFGLHHFGEELTGPEYAGRFVEQAEEAGAEIWTDTMVLSVTKDREIVCMNPQRGLVRLRAGAVVLAMGCRERTRGALSIPGTRPAGVYTAGCAQRLVNMEGFLPGRRVVILGSGDIGLIMARRMTWEGAEVKLVAELMPYSSGLNRNIVQCLVDNGIPLKFNHTVVRILGKERVEGVVVAEVDPATRAPVPGTEETVECDTLMLSVGLLPENELTTAAGVALDPVTGGAAVDQTRQTSVPGVFACGNVLHVHDLVDNVTAESLLAGEAAAIFATGEGLCPSPNPSRAVRAAGAVRYVVPQRVAADAEGTVDLYFRVGSVQKPAVCEVRCGGKVVATRRKPVMTPGEMEKITVDAAKIADDVEVFVSSPETPPRAGAAAPTQGAAPGETTMTCICCPMGCRLTIAPKEGGGWTVTGNGCPRGAKYAVQEMEAPERVVTSTVRVEGGAAPLVAAKTAAPVPKSSIPACLDAIRALAVPAPVARGAVLAPDLAGTGVALVATSEVP
ncbi:MAG: FAD-dependent oxidoreductase [Kiritimatiellae bacterium]|nr:FAD-dependent oxidoreductase [Kiritimatiellia bacterium]